MTEDASDGGASVGRVAFLGLGIMGSRMAANLLRAGFDVALWNRTRERAEAVAAGSGGEVAATPAEAAARAELAITMVVDAPEVEAVLFGPGGAAEALAPGGLVVDMSTIAPSAARAVAARLAADRVELLDAPVTGSKPKAEDATLTIMVGGRRDAYERALPLFKAMGAVIVHAGPQGHGQMVKLINNTVAAVNAAAVGEALVLARKADVDVDALVQVMASGSGRSAMLELKGEAMRTHDFKPLFKLAHMLKDVRHCLAEAEALGVDLTLGRPAADLYAAAALGGNGDADFAAVIEVIEAAAGLSPPGKLGAEE